MREVRLRVHADAGVGHVTRHGGLAEYGIHGGAGRRAMVRARGGHRRHAGGAQSLAAAAYRSECS